MKCMRIVYIRWHKYVPQRLYVGKTTTPEQFVEQLRDAELTSVDAVAEELCVGDGDETEETQAFVAQVNALLQQRS